MTESEYLTSTDVQSMLTFLRTSVRGVTYDNPTIAAGVPLITPRKLRLFAVACARQVWDGVPCQRCGGQGWTGNPSEEGTAMRCGACHGGRVGGLTDPRIRKAVETAEKYADGAATERALRDAHRYLDLEAAHDPTWVLAYAACELPETTHPPDISRARDAAVPPATQAALLRCIAGNPFQESIYGRRIAKLQSGVVSPSLGQTALGVAPSSDCQGVAARHSGTVAQATEEENLASWRGWDGGTVPQMARAIYEDRDWALLPQLADALESAGCPAGEACLFCGGAGRFTPSPSGDPTCRPCGGTGRVGHPLLDHLRAAVPHARGCHAVDCLLNLS